MHLNGCHAVSSLLKRYSKAVNGIQELKEAFDELSETVDENLLEKWKQDEARAMDSRGEHLRIFDVKMEKGIFRQLV
jgi:hypothetical protein